MLLTLLKALADSTRLRLLALLRHGEFTVSDLVELLGMGQSRISRHLKILTEAGVIDVKRQGTWGYYHIADADPLVQALLEALESRFDLIDHRREDLDALACLLEKRRSHSREFFDRHARSWDQLVEQLLPTPNLTDLLAETVPRVETILEVGAGTGSLLSEVASKSTRFVVVDHSERMLAEARNRAQALGLVHGDFRLGEMTHLPLESAEADCVVARMVLHHAAQPQAVLGEFCRVLHPGGTLVLVDLLRHDKEWVRERLADLWLGFEPSEIDRWSAQAGFENIRTRIVPAQEPEQSVFVLVATKGGNR